MHGLYLQENYYMTYKEKRILFNWLYKQGALRKYKKARYEYSHIKRAFRSYTQLNFIEAIIGSFDWGSTLEGSFYWVDLHRAWKRFLQKYD